MPPRCRLGIVQRGAQSQSGLVRTSLEDTPRSTLPRSVQTAVNGRWGTKDSEQPLAKSIRQATAFQIFRLGRDSHRSTCFGGSYCRVGHHFFRRHPHGERNCSSDGAIGSAKYRSPTGICVPWSEIAICPWPFPLDLMKVRKPTEA